MAELSLIKALCEEKGIALSKLAKEAKISYNGLQRIIADNSTRTETLQRIAKALGVPISYFFPDDPGLTIYFDELDRDLIEKDIEANGLSEYKYEILSAFNFVDTDIKGKFVDLDKKNSSLTKEGVVNEIFIRYIMKWGHNKELDHMRETIEDKEQIIKFLKEKLKSIEDGQSLKE